MLLATWNVNSIRARIDRVIDWVERNSIDIVALQETKCKDEQFPYDRFTEAGYEVAHWGLNQWNGVAIASRVGLSDVACSFDGQPGFSKEPDLFDPPQEARAIGATCAGIRVWSLYIPNGRDLNDPHYQYKLEWLDELFLFSQREATQYSQLALCGDWNIIPHDTDVWDVREFDGKTHVTPAERERFFRFLHHGFTDPVTERTPGQFTYWDYTQLRFPKGQGMRIDFSLVSSALEARVSAASIDREERKGKGASDHAPVILVIDQ